MAHKELKILYRILAILGTLLVIAVIAGYIFIKIRAPHLIRVSKGISDESVHLKMEDLGGVYFYKGMEGCENLYLDTASLKIWVTELSGHIALLEGDLRSDLKLSQRKKIGQMALGITRTRDSLIYLAVSDHKSEDWKKEGGRIVCLDSSLNIIREITGPYPALNGITTDPHGRIYFVSGNFNALKPEGKIYFIEKDQEEYWSDPVLINNNAGMCNGIWYDPFSKKIYFSNSVEGIFALEDTMNRAAAVYTKTRFMELFDDFCFDRKGNLWMTDPGGSTLKVYLPDKKKLVRFLVDGIGQTSSCRIRIEDEGEIIYITELKQKQKPRSEVLDGRGVLSLPLHELMKTIGDNTEKNQ